MRPSTGEWGDRAVHPRHRLGSPDCQRCARSRHALGCSPHASAATCTGRANAWEGGCVKDSLEVGKAELPDDAKPQKASTDGWAGRVGQALSLSLPLRLHIGEAQQPRRARRVQACFREQKQADPAGICSMAYMSYLYFHRPFSTFIRLCAFPLVQTGDGLQKQGIT